MVNLDMRTRALLRRMIPQSAMSPTNDCRPLLALRDRQSQDGQGFVGAFRCLLPLLSRLHPRPRVRSFIGNARGCRAAA